MSTVKNIIEKKQKTFNKIESTSTVIDAISMLNAHDLSYLVVMEGDKFMGIFGEREYTRNIILHGRASNTTMVKDAMTTDLLTVNFTDSIVHCIQLINSHKARYLLAYDDNIFVDVITVQDLLRHALISRDPYDKAISELLIGTGETSKFFF
jgi:predicted transcriptional regulator